MKKLVVHLGSHKTATTHFQDTLALMSQDLKERGVSYLAPVSYTHLTLPTILRV